jgi:hypothetical protein
MSDQPDGAELLRVARQSLLDDLLPVLPQAQRYAALMCANAMAIAAREGDAGRNGAPSDLSRLRALYPDVAGEDSDPAQTQNRLNRRLADDLREGRIEAGIESDVFALLMDRTRARLRISNPKHLSSWDIE